MCMTYKGVNYSYAFEFKAWDNYSQIDRIFRIVISEYDPVTRNYSGLCLENELKVFSKEKIPFLAFFEIVNDIVDFTILGDKDYIDAHPSEKPPTPLMYVEKADFIKQFEEKKKSGKSLEQYEQLKDFFRKPEIMSENLSDEKKFEICDYPKMLFLSHIIREKKPDVKNVIYFRT